MIVETPAFYQSSVEYARYIAEDHLGSGIRFLDAVYATLEFIHDAPHIGRCWRDEGVPGLRVWRVSGFPNHLIFYRPVEQGIEAVDLIHGARDLDTLLPE